MHDSRSTSRLLVLWVLGGAVMLATFWAPPLVRTQEARVLETAREMLGAPGRQWVIPLTNGAVRLRKPPLAYWLSAGAMAVFGVSTAAGRVPEVVAAWLTLGLTFAVARRLFGQRAALLAAGAMLGSRLFLKYALLAETDALAMALVTCGVWLILQIDGRMHGRMNVRLDERPDARLDAGRGGEWPLADPVLAGPRVRAGMAGMAGTAGTAGVAEAVGVDRVGVRIETDTVPGIGTLPGRGVGWRFHALAACVALAALAKGPPAGYLVLFLLFIAVLRRDGRVVWRFFTGGAIVTLVLLAVPWFAAVYFSPDAGQLIDDAHNSVVGGSGHAASFLTYIPQLAQATLPWTIVWLAALLMCLPALLEGATRWRAARVPQTNVAAKAASSVDQAAEQGLPDDSRADARVGDAASTDARGLLVLAGWGGVILVPLCLWGNKQIHYLLPLMPATFCLVGWALDRWLWWAEGSTRQGRAADGGDEVVSARGDAGAGNGGAGNRFLSEVSGNDLIQPQHRNAGAWDAQDAQSAKPSDRSLASENYQASNDSRTSDELKVSGQSPSTDATSDVRHRVPPGDVHIADAPPTHARTEGPLRRTAAACTRYVGVIVWVMIAALAVLAAALVPWGHRARGYNEPGDYAAALLLLAALAAAVAWRGRPGRVVWVTVVLTVLLCGGVLGVWTASLDRVTPDSIARTLTRQYPTARFVFRGDAHLPLCFALRRVCPERTDAQLADALASPGGGAAADDLPLTIALERTEDRTLKPAPAGFLEAIRFRDGDAWVRVFAPVALDPGQQRVDLP